METLNLKDLKDLKLTVNESKDIIKLIAKKRNTTINFLYSVFRRQKFVWHGYVRKIAHKRI